MRFFKSFRLLHRRAKSENDVSALFPKLNQDCAATPVKRSRSAQYVHESNSTSTNGSNGTPAPTFVSLDHSLPSFDPAELYSPLDVPWSPVSTLPSDIASPPEWQERFLKLQADYTQLKDSKNSLEKDLDDLRVDLSSTRSELYSEMFRTARHQRQANTDFQHIQRLELKYQQITGLLADIGIPQSIIEQIRSILTGGTGDPDDVLLEAIRSAIQDSSTPLAKLKHIVGPRTPEHYQSALDMTLSVRREIKGHKKVSKFWKKLAQENGGHANMVTPSSSNISSIREPLSPERQSAVNALITKRRNSRGLESSSMFGMASTEPSLDPLASRIACQPRTPNHYTFTSTRSVSPSVFVVACDSPSTTSLQYLSVVTPHHHDVSKDGLLTPSRSSQFIENHSSPRLPRVLGEVDMNVSRSSPFRVFETEFIGDQDTPEDQVQSPDVAITLSRELIQNMGRASLGHGHRRNPSMTSQRSESGHSNSLHLSTSSPVRSLVSAITDAFPQSAEEDDLDMDRQSLGLSRGHLRRTSAISDNEPSFDNSAFHCLLYGANSPRISTDGDISSPDCGDISVSGGTSQDISSADFKSRSRFLEHINEYSNGSLLILDSSFSTPVTASPGFEGMGGEFKESLFVTSQGTPTTGPTTPSTTPPSSELYSPKSKGEHPVLKHLRRLSSTSTPGSNSIANKICGLPRWVRSPGGTESSSGSTDASPVTAVPKIHRRKTIRANNMSASGTKATVGLGMS
ncbi:hypothetical protein BJ138DRAFT_851886 [Hygrophoropsis aurantiaca]|uniref:Uncharacterized protein n=1 Tax=Hygrophoropsis aurantiaca TaxID=72124 RepID=A0ACB8AGA0_9AGAM|nr:hypothetical protein BJ138DRAFT_851886 [Hygrophoropsis aurantiaca]